MTIQELYEKLRPSKTSTASAQILADTVSVNLSDMFTRLIRDAARCNSYSSDVFYSLTEIDEKIRNYHGKALSGAAQFEPIFIGFRRHGVDGNSFILSRIEGNPYNVHREYFALYSVAIEQKDAGWATVVFNEYWM